MTEDGSLRPKKKFSQSHKVIAALYSEQGDFHLSSDFLIGSRLRIKRGSSLKKPVVSETQSLYHIIFHCKSTKAHAAFLVKQRKVRLIRIRPRTLTDG